nr:DUF3888 domain-containing protein [Ureibacillus galli]
MKKMFLVFILLLPLITSFYSATIASDIPSEDSEELRLQDMLMNMLTPYIENDLQNFYTPNIVENFSPAVAPWKIEVLETKRINGFRGFHLQITFEIEPTDGGH